MEIYKEMGEEMHFRSLEVFQDLIKPWRPDELGYRMMDEWHGIELALSEEELKSVASAAGGGGYGVYLVK